MGVFGGRGLKYKGHARQESSTTSNVRLTGVFHVNILLNYCLNSNWSVLSMKCTRTRWERKQGEKRMGESVRVGWGGVEGGGCLKEKDDGRGGRMFAASIVSRSGRGSRFLFCSRAHWVLRNRKPGDRPILTDSWCPPIAVPRLPVSHTQWFPPWSRPPGNQPRQPTLHAGQCTFLSSSVLAAAVCCVCLPRIPWTFSQRSVFNTTPTFLYNFPQICLLIYNICILCRALWNLFSLFPSSVSFFPNDILFQY